MPVRDGDHRASAIRVAADSRLAGRRSNQQAVAVHGRRQHHIRQNRSPQPSSTHALTYGNVTLIVWLAASIINNSDMASSMNHDHREAGNIIMDSC
ncbi:hypothetical protein U9M48_032620 [Paspalum notatum var. saurae]|uniref:Uncharacterized protein n=1 Tax=Paspalum notatum var. saurae TaxID=547442 RepID=A0AAQ3X5L6_PASNO